MDIHLRGMTKSYGEVTVLADVSLTLRGGQVHALMGENGAGKSTLIRLLAGATRADTMQVLLDDNRVQITSPHDAYQAGFRFIHQELNIVPQLTVAENILLGRETPRRFGLFIDWPKLYATAEAALAELDVDHINPRDQAGSLGTGDQMLMRIASALVQRDGEADPCLYVLDEPTAALSETESERLFAVVKRLAAKGAAILYVSHRMEEIKNISDEVTVLRNGKRVVTAPTAELAQTEIVQHMTGRELSDIFPDKSEPVSKEVVLLFDQVHTPRLSNISLELRAGEIVGVGGLADSGQSELLMTLLGIEKIQGGSANLLGQPLPKSPSEAWSRGLALVPKERRAQGLMMGMAITNNILLPHLRGWWSSSKQEQQKSSAVSERVQLRFDTLGQSVWQLSGGNQQKVVFGRALAEAPKLLLLDEPTRGVDIGARQEIYRMISDLADQGTAVIMVSSDLSELIGLSDRILVLQDGCQTGIASSQNQRPDTLLEHYYNSAAKRA